MYLAPLKHKLLSLLGAGDEELSAVCARSWQLAPATQQTVAPPIYNPADLERITSSPGPAPLARQLQDFHSTTRHHLPTTAFLLEDVDAVQGYLYCRRWKQALMPAPVPIWARRPELQIAHGSLACTWYGNIYFGHWICDDVPLHLAAEQTGEPVILERSAYLHEPGYRDLLAAPRHAIERAHFDTLVIIRDAAQNDYKRRRLEVLRSRLGAQLRGAGAQRIFISRGLTGQQRAIVNAEELQAYITSQGFCSIDPERLSAAQIAARTWGSRVVLGMEGSHMAHALLTMAPGGVLCCIQPPWQFTSVLREYTQNADVRYAVVVGHAAPGGLRVDLDDLKRVLERIEAALPAA